MPQDLLATAAEGGPVLPGDVIAQEPRRIDTRLAPEVTKRGQSPQGPTAEEPIPVLVQLLTPDSDPQHEAAEEAVGGHAKRLAVRGLLVVHAAAVRVTRITAAER